MPCHAVQSTAHPCMPVPMNAAQARRRGGIRSSGEEQEAWGKTTVDSHTSSRQCPGRHDPVAWPGLFCPAARAKPDQTRGGRVCVTGCVCSQGTGRRTDKTCRARSGGSPNEITDGPRKAGRQEKKKKKRIIIEREKEKKKIDKSAGQLRSNMIMVEC